ncbi:protein SPO16 homolog [Diadema antillarum]|uniref:protein SPO16 homolog n=1 Tax=Diadema antillarum TaxID=105358 RepID=UPI003A8753F6
MASKNDCGKISQVNANSKWPIVIHNEQKNNEISRLLQQRHKVRFSDSTVPGTFIFPLSAIAFMVTPLDKVSLEWPPKSGHIQLDHDFVDRVLKFIQIHRNSYLVVSSALHGPHEMEVIAAIQFRFVDSNLKILPVHNDAECVQTIQTIAQATCKPTSTILKSRLDGILSHQSREEVVLNILSQIGLRHHECLVLQQGFGSLSAIAMATREQLMDCSLDNQTATKVQTFFKMDNYAEE